MLSRSVGRRRARVAADPADEGDEVRTATVTYRGRALTFFIDNPRDSVQKFLARGRFYEADLLASHRDLIFRGSTVLDVGANVGNHSVFYALNGPRRVYVFEPNPRANALLRRTVDANGLHSVDLVHVDLGLAASPGSRYLCTPDRNNLGKTLLRERGTVRVSVRPLDDLPVEGRISFIKVDVEGMEMDVLEGARETLARHRPGLGVEVDDTNASRFWSWLDDNAYHVVRVVRNYPKNANYVCVPRS